MPNFNIGNVKKLLRSGSDGEDSGLEVIMNSAYHATRDYVSPKQIYKYPLIHSTPKSGVRYMYSKINDEGHFDIPKVIFGEAGINDVIIDMDGKYGMTQGAIGIKINSEEEGNLLKTALLSTQFNMFLKSCSFGNYRIDWKLFSYLKKDFYNEFSKKLINSL